MWHELIALCMLVAYVYRGVRSPLEPKWTTYIEFSEIGYLILILYFAFGVLWETAFTCAVIISVTFWSTGFGWTTASIRDFVVQSDVHLSNVVLVLAELIIDRPNYRGGNWWHVLTFLICYFLLHAQFFIVDARWRLDFLALHRGWTAFFAHVAMVILFLFTFLIGLWMHENAIVAWVLTAIASAIAVFGISIWVIDHDDAKRWIKEVRDGENV